MEKLKIIIQLTRINKPIGIMLLFWPCLWGLTLGYFYDYQIEIYLKYIILFLLGSILMRSAGCIFNDIADKNFDKKVERTKSRPLASEKISVLEAFVYIILICLLALLILIQFNKLTIILGMGSMILAFAYPFMKRITYWPQLFLGLTFNWGIIMGWAALTNHVSIEALLLYLSAIFWTLGYDTIYGLQDIKDDEIIGVKSTSIKFKNNPKVFVGSCYCLCVLFILIMYLVMKMNNYSLLKPEIALLILLPFIISLAYQVKIFNKNNPKSCLNAFKSNNFSGFLIFIFIFSFKIL